MGYLIHSNIYNILGEQIGGGHIARK
jgi:hypothetical protein